MKKIQTQGVHHITLNGADRQTSIDFWQGVLGMPFVFEQPNLDDHAIGHLYFDPGDGRLITVFTSEDRKPGAPVKDQTGSVHHLAFQVSLATYKQVAARLDARGIAHSGEIDRGFMWSISFRDPCGQRLALAPVTFEPPPRPPPPALSHRAPGSRVDPEGGGLRRSRQVTRCVKLDVS